MEYISGLIFRQHPRQQSAHLRIDFIKDVCARAGTIYMCVYLYIYDARMECMNTECIWWPRSATGGSILPACRGLLHLVSPPFPLLAMTWHGTMRSMLANSIVKPRLSPSEEFAVYGVFFLLIGESILISCLFLPGPRSLRFICDANRPIRFRCCLFHKTKFLMISLMINPWLCNHGLVCCDIWAILW